MACVEERFVMFREMLEGVSPIYITEFDENYEIIYDNNPNTERFRKLFCLERAERTLVPVEEGLKLVEADVREPVIFTNGIGMTWLSDACVEDGRIVRIFLLGPIFLDNYALWRLDLLLGRLQMEAAVREEYMELLKGLPVISMRQLCEFGIMLHRAVTGKVITRSDFQYADCYEDSLLPEEMRPDFQAMLNAEQRICRMIEEGNQAYRKEESQLFSLCENMLLGSHDELRWIKNAAIILCTLYMRAAIVGGMELETAYTMGCACIREIEEMQDGGSVRELVDDLVESFTRAVSRHRTQKGISLQIQKICDYIGLHLEENMTIQELAARGGYKDYYFSNKFKKEVGVSVREYIRKKRVTRAKALLLTSTMDVQEISQMLGFESISYFGGIFKRETGMSPGEYRQSSRQRRKDVIKREEADLFSELKRETGMSSGE